MHFISQDVPVTIKGVPPVLLKLSEIHAKQLIKWYKGNDIWAYALVDTTFVEDTSPHSSEISQLLEEYADVFEHKFYLKKVKCSFGQQHIEYLGHIISALAISSLDSNGYELVDGIIKRQGLIWVGQNLALKTKIIAAMHSSPVGGHSGFKATYYRIKKLFGWKGLRADVDEYVKQCQICQHAKHELIHPPGVLHPLPVPTGAWTDVTMDFIEGLPTSESFNAILVVVDRFTKLSLKYFGPYRVLARVGDAAYKLQLPKGAQIHPVLHVSQLKPFTPNYSPVYFDVTQFAELYKEVVIPEVILDRRLVKKGNQAVTQVLIKWTNLPTSSATWEDYNVVKERFPSAVAWGQATSQGGGTGHVKSEYIFSS
ncbi:hypothetical protein U9M48_032667 [Paspalum notatum var. saurae]|uniref:Chromo domain-containing protein n=1 Tax=Paspalum notatum var. saurae TaxID=547442 RepID=A0AAQ3U698_PASNO